MDQVDHAPHLDGVRDGRVTQKGPKMVQPQQLRAGESGAISSSNDAVVRISPHIMTQLSPSYLRSLSTKKEASNVHDQTNSSDRLAVDSSSGSTVRSAFHTITPLSGSRLRLANEYFAQITAARMLQLRNNKDEQLAAGLAGGDTTLAGDGSKSRVGTTTTTTLVQSDIDGDDKPRLDRVLSPAVRLQALLAAAAQFRNGSAGVSVGRTPSGMLGKHKSGTCQALVAASSLLTGDSKAMPVAAASTGAAAAAGYSPMSEGPALILAAMRKVAQTAALGGGGIGGTVNDKAGATPSIATGSQQIAGGGIVKNARQRSAQSGPDDSSGSGSVGSEEELIRDIVMHSNGSTSISSDAAAESGAGKRLSSHAHAVGLGSVDITSSTSADAMLLIGERRPAAPLAQLVASQAGCHTTGDSKRSRSGSVSGKGNGSYSGGDSGDATDDESYIDAVVAVEEEELEGAVFDVDMTGVGALAPSSPAHIRFTSRDVFKLTTTTTSTSGTKSAGKPGRGRPRKYANASKAFAPAAVAVAAIKPVPLHAHAIVGSGTTSDGSSSGSASTISASSSATSGRGSGGGSSISTYPSSLIPAPADYGGTASVQTVAAVFPSGPGSICDDVTTSRLLAGGMAEWRGGGKRHNSHCAFCASHLALGRNPRRAGILTCPFCPASCHDACYAQRLVSAHTAPCVLSAPPAPPALAVDLQPQQPQMGNGRAVAVGSGIGVNTNIGDGSSNNNIAMEVEDCAIAASSSSQVATALTAAATGSKLTTVPPDMRWLCQSCTDAGRQLLCQPQSGDLTARPTLLTAALTGGAGSGLAGIAGAGSATTTSPSARQAMTLTTHRKVGAASSSTSSSSISGSHHKRHRSASSSEGSFCSGTTHRATGSGGNFSGHNSVAVSPAVYSQPKHRRGEEPPLMSLAAAGYDDDVMGSAGSDGAASLLPTAVKAPAAAIISRLCLPSISSSSSNSERYPSVVHKSSAPATLTTSVTSAASSSSSSVAAPGGGSTTALPPSPIIGTVLQSTTGPSGLATVVASQYSNGSSGTVANITLLPREVIGGSNLSRRANTNTAAQEVLYRTKAGNRQPLFSSSSSSSPSLLGNASSYLPANKDGLGFARLGLFVAPPPRAAAVAASAAITSTSSSSLHAHKGVAGLGSALSPLKQKVGVAASRPAESALGRGSRGSAVKGFVPSAAGAPKTALSSSSSSSMAAAPTIVTAKSVTGVSDSSAAGAATRSSGSSDGGSSDHTEEVAVALRSFPVGTFVTKAEAEAIAAATKWPLARSHVRQCRWCDSYRAVTGGLLLCRYCPAAWHRACLGVPPGGLTAYADGEGSNISGGGANAASSSGCEGQGGNSSGGPATATPAPVTTGSGWVCPECSLDVCNSHVLVRAQKDGTGTSCPTDNVNGASAAGTSPAISSSSASTASTSAAAPVSVNPVLRSLMGRYAAITSTGSS